MRRVVKSYCAGGRNAPGFALRGVRREEWEQDSMTSAGIRRRGGWTAVTLLFALASPAEKKPPPVPPPDVKPAVSIDVAELGYKAYPDVLTATIGLGLMCLIGIISVHAVRRRLSRETWWLIHLWMYLALAISFAHVIVLGPAFV